MNKKKFSVASYINRREEIATRLNEIADVAERENNRALTDAESDEVETLKRELGVLDLRIAGASRTGGMVEVSERELQFDAFLREAIASKELSHNIPRVREAVMTTGAAPIIPLTVNDIVGPLEDGLIYDKVGIKLLTGLAGEYVWPLLGSIEATVADENAALSDASLTIGKVKPEPKRVGITISITNQTLTQTHGVALELVKMQLPKAIARTLNKCMFATSKALKLYGPFAEIATGSAKKIDTLKTIEAKKGAFLVEFAAEIPTYKELLAMRGLALVKGVEAESMAYIMDEYTKAMLEATPREAGSGMMVVENGKIAGIPVYCTNAINDTTTTYVGFGCFNYLPLQGFGDMRFVIDPYTEAAKDAVRFTLNSDWAMNALRKEAFVLGKCKSV